MTKQQTMTTIQYKDLIVTKIKQNYQSIILSLLIIGAGVSLILKSVNLQKQTVSKKANETNQEQIKQQKGKTYTVKKGDHLWKIAKEVYGSGYNAYDIAKANKITNPSVIFSGQVLVIPSVIVKEKTVVAQAKTVNEVKAKEAKKEVSVTNYTIKREDSLWKIAKEVYQDPYQWVKIAKANKLVNPNIIHQGNVLTIPR